MSLIGDKGDTTLLLIVMFVDTRYAIANAIVKNPAAPQEFPVVGISPATHASVDDRRCCRRLLT